MTKPVGKSLLIFILITILAPWSVCRADTGDDSTTRYFVVFDDPITFDPQSLKIEGSLSPKGTLNTVSITLGTNHKVDETSFLYQGLNLLRQNTNETAGVNVTLVRRSGVSSGWIKLTRKEQLNIAYTFLRKANNTLYHDSDKIIHDNELSEASQEYLKEFFPLAADKALKMKGWVESSGIREVVARQPKSKEMLNRLDYAVSQLQELAIFTEGMGQLKTMGLFADPAVNQKFQKQAEKIFGEAAQAFNSVISNRAHTEFLTQPETKAYVDKLSLLFDSAIVKTSSPPTNEIVTEVAKARLQETERLMKFNPLAMPKDLGSFRRVQRDLLLGFGFINLAQIHSLPSLAVGVFSLTVWSLIQYKQRQMGRQEHRLIEAILAGNGNEVCNIELGNLPK